MAKKWIFALLLITLLLGCNTPPEAAETPAPLDVSYVEFESTNYPVTLRYPQGWTIMDGEDTIRIVSDDGQPPEARIELTFTPIIMMGGGNLLELVEMGSRSIAEQEDAELVQEVTMVDINNQQAAHTQVRGETGGEQVFLEYALIMSNTADQVATVIAVTQQDAEGAYLPVVNEIIQSIDLLPLAQAE